MCQIPIKTLDIFATNPRPAIKPRNLLIDLVSVSKPFNFQYPLSHWSKFNFNLHETENQHRSVLLAAPSWTRQNHSRKISITTILRVMVFLRSDGLEQFFADDVVVETPGLWNGLHCCWFVTESAEACAAAKSELQERPVHPCPRLRMCSPCATRGERKSVAIIIKEIRSHAVLSPIICAE